MSGDQLASLRARGAVIPSRPTLGRMIRETPHVVGELHQHEVASGIDVVCALTSATTPRALAPIGMAFRAAALTGTAVDLATEAAASAARRVAVAGLLGHTVAAPLADRIAEDYAIHAARLAAAGCEILVASGFEPRLASSVPPALARLARRAAVVSANTTQLATWALVEIDATGRTPDGEGLEEHARSALDSGADALLFEVASVELGLAVLRRLQGVAEGSQIGLLLGAAFSEAQASERGANSEGIDDWVAAAARLLDAGAQILGGGTGATAGHLAALAKAIRSTRAPLLRRAL